MKCIIYLFWGSAGHDEINMSVKKTKNESKTDMEGRERESREQMREQQNKRENSKYDIHVS